MPEEYDQICNELRKLYQKLLSGPPQSLVDRLGCPFLVLPRERWCQAARRVLLVGQEPWEWGFNAGLHYKWPHPALWYLKEALEYSRSVEALTSAY
jgi:hypothetical protein